MDIMINIIVGCVTVLVGIITILGGFMLIKVFLSMYYDVADQTKEFDERNPIKKIRYSDNKQIEELLRKASLSEYNDRETQDGWNTLYNIVKEYNKATVETRQVNNNGYTNVAGAYFKYPFGGK